ncbi:MAG TPA: nucleoside deaminase [Gammaproteobacteria bacterium]|nr:nucleoside deaminase [Gammaproteobacteria bacterium]
MTISQREQAFLHRAIELANRSVDTGGGPFGAVIVSGDEVVGRGHNRVTLDLDPTAHAEVQAIRDACRRRGDFSLQGCVLYASCEPCPMCMAAIYWARIERVVFAASGEDAARAGFDDRLIAREICRPYRERSLPVEQYACEGYDSAFRKWMALVEKTPY